MPNWGKNPFVHPLYILFTCHSLFLTQRRETNETHRSIWLKLTDKATYYRKGRQRAPQLCPFLNLLLHSENNNIWDEGFKIQPGFSHKESS